MLGLEMHHFGSLIPFLVQKDADAADEGAGQLRQMCREDRSGGGRLQGFARLGFNGLDDRHLKAQKRAEEVAANQQSIGPTSRAGEVVSNVQPWRSRVT